MQALQSTHTHKNISKVPNDWKLYKLGAISKLFVPMRDKPKKFDGDIPWLRIEDLNEKFASDSKSNQRVTKETVKKMNLRIYPVGTVLCSCSATIGVCAITTRNLITNQTFIGIYPNPQLDKEFLYYYLLTQGDNLRKIGSGSTIPYISREKFESFLIPLPPLREQQKIASVLSRVDELIQKTSQIIEYTQRLKKGLMQTLLTKGIGYTRFKKTKLGEIPEKWQVRKLEDCVLSDTSITYGIVQAGPDVPDGIPYIRTGDMSAGRLSKQGLLHTSMEIDSSYPRSRVKAGDIICALRGTVGSVLEVPEGFEGVNLSRGVARISPGNRIHGRYLLWALRSEYARREFDVFSNGTTFKEIPLAQLRAIKVAVPVSEKEQRSLATIFDGLELIIECRQRYEKKLMILKAGLMQQLLTGKIRVKV